MALGITREELNQWKQEVASGRIAYLTHYWRDDRFPHLRTVTKVGCADLARLTAWCLANGLDPAYIHYREEYPHFDLLGTRQKEILLREGLSSHLERFRL